MAQFLINFLHVYQFLDSEDLAGDIGCYGVVDGAQTLVQAKGFEDAARFPGKTDGGAHEGDAEEGSGGRGGHFLDAIEDQAGGLVLEYQGVFVVARWTWESYLVWVAQGFREVALSSG